MTSTWLLYVICALMLLAAIAAVLPTVLRTKNDVNGEALDREATALATKALQAEKAKLDADRSLGRISEAEYESLLTDLRRRVIEEQKPAADPTGAPSSSANAKPSTRLSRVQLAVSVAVLITVVAGGLLRVSRVSRDARIDQCPKGDGGQRLSRVHRSVSEDCA